jgi:aspartyl-tRNA(Asn)/glutamyl-tRNA(Gln) amidotransferase subunit A
VKRFYSGQQFVRRVQSRKAYLKIAAGEYVGHLHGISIMVKDALDAKGLLSTGGAMELKDNILIRDAPAVNAMKEAGAICFWKD